MAKKSVIIIGAGLAGLSAGCYAQLNGYESRIFEHHSVPGGVAATWKRKEFLIEGGIHFICGYRQGTGMYEIFREIGAAAPGNFVDFPVFIHLVDETAGRELRIGRDMDELHSRLESLCPSDSDFLRDFFSGVKALMKSDLTAMNMSKPAALHNFFDTLKDMWEMKGILGYFSGRHGQAISDYVKKARDPWLRECLERLFMPDVPTWFVMMVLAMHGRGDLGLLGGGSLDFARSVEKRYLSLGGNISYRSKVQEIIVESGRASGVRLADGSVHRSDYVISACDGHSVIFDMLQGRYVNQKIQERHEQWGISTPLVMASFGVAREFPGEAPYITVKLKDPIELDGHRLDHMQLRIFNYSDRFSPPGKSVIQATAEMGWDFWCGLREKDKGAYDDAKQRLSAEFLKRFEARYPGISSQVEVTDVATPYTTWRYTLNRKGAWGGWKMSPRMAATRIEMMLPGLGSFLMAGHWVMPGVSGAIFSGRHAVQLMCHFDGRPFEVAAPAA